MRKFLFLAVLLIMATQLHAQDETLFRKTQREGFYIAPTFESGTFDDDGSHWSGGGSIGLILDNFSFGIYGLAAADYHGWIENDEVDQLDIVHGGLELFYTHQPYRLIHPYIGTRVGWGAAVIDLNNELSNEDNIFVLTPQIGLELNVASWFRIAGYGAYRHVNGINDAQPFNDNDVSGFLAGVSLKLGWFGRNRRRGCR